MIRTWAKHSEHVRGTNDLHVASPCGLAREEGTWLVFVGLNDNQLLPKFCTASEGELHCVFSWHCCPYRPRLDTESSRTAVREIAACPGRNFAEEAKIASTQSDRKLKWRVAPVVTVTTETRPGWPSSAKWHDSTCLQQTSKAFALAGPSVFCTNVLPIASCRFSRVEIALPA